MVFSISGITLTSSTLTPIELSHIAKVDVFVSCVRPDKISFPSQANLTYERIRC